MKKLKKQFVVSLCALAIPSIASAQTSWALRQEQDVFSVQGECSENTLKIELFKKVGDKDPAYAKEINCEDGKFFISSDTIKKDIPIGNYFIAVDGQTSSNPLSISKDEGDSPKVEVAPEIAATATDPDIGFLNSFLNLQKSLLEMRTALSMTTYSSVIKNGIDATIDGIEKISGKITELLFSSEKAEGGKIALPDKTPVSAIQETEMPENTATVVTEDSQKQDTGENMANANTTVNSDGVTAQ